MSDIFSEVDEEIRRSRAEALWSRYGVLIFSICVLIVLAVAGWRFMDWRREQAAAEAGAKFEEAIQLLQTGKPAEAEVALGRIAAEDAGIYRALAQLRANAELAKRDPQAAIRAFDAIAADAGLGADLRDVARMRSGAIAVDSLPLAEVEQRLAPLIGAGNVWRHQAREFLAAAAFKAGQLDKAREHLDAIIIDREAPANVKSRAEVLIGLTRGTT